MNHDSYPDAYIRGILNTVKTIAMVGISPKDNRPSYFAFKYLLERGYNMIPVNPGQAGKAILGRKVYARLADVPEPIDMVDVFRAAQYAPQIVAEVMTTIRRLKESGLSIVLVEQSPKLVFDIADDMVILNSGKVAVTSTAAKLRSDGIDLRQHLGVF